MHRPTCSYIVSRTFSKHVPWQNLLLHGDDALLDFKCRPRYHLYFQINSYKTNHHVYTCVYIFITDKSEVMATMSVKHFSVCTFVKCIVFLSFCTIHLTLAFTASQTIQMYNEISVFCRSYVSIWRWQRRYLPQSEQIPSRSGPGPERHHQISNFVRKWARRLRMCRWQHHSIWPPFRCKSAAAQSRVDIGQAPNFVFCEGPKPWLFGIRVVSELGRHDVLSCRSRRRWRNVGPASLTPGRRYANVLCYCRSCIPRWRATPLFRKNLERYALRGKCC